MNIDSPSSAEYCWGGEKKRMSVLYTMNRMGLMGERDERMTIRMMVIMMTIMIMVMIMTMLVIRKRDGSHQLMHVCACCLYDGVVLYM